MKVKVHRGFNAQTPFSEAKNQDELKKILILKYPKACSNLEVDARVFADMVEGIEKYKAYKTLGFKTLEEFCEAKLAMTLKMAMKIVTGVKARISEGRKGKIPVEEAVVAAKAQVDPESPEYVRPEGGRPSKETHNNIMGLKQQGTSTEYTLLCMARDGHDKLLDRIKNGEISVNAAAIEVGYRKKLTPYDRLKAAWEKASSAERKKFLALIRK